MTDIKNQLLDHAVKLIQKRGFNGFSFHDLAELTGIKTSSIHYHYPTKTLLGRAVVERYTLDFIVALGDPQSGTLESQLKHYALLFRKTMATDSMCLCGMISAEIGGLPQELKNGISKFFDINQEWLNIILIRGGLPKTSAKQRALMVVATLEGALLLYRAKGDVVDFDAIVKMTLSDAIRQT